MTLLSEIGETYLAQVIPKISKAQIAKVVKKYVVRFTPKYKVFSILQNNIEDVVKNSTQMWKLTYGLTTVKEGELEPIEVKDDDQDDTVEGGTKMKIDEKATTELE